MWKANFNDDLKKVVLESDSKGAYYLDYTQDNDGIYLSKKHLEESGLNAFDLDDISSALESYNCCALPHIYINNNN